MKKTALLFVKWLFFMLNFSGLANEMYNYTLENGVTGFNRVLISILSDLGKYLLFFGVVHLKLVQNHFYLLYTRILLVRVLLPLNGEDLFRQLFRNRQFFLESRESARDALLPKTIIKFLDILFRRSHNGLNFISSLPSS